MERYNLPSDKSMGFVIKVSDSGVYMDVKNIVLLSGNKGIFKAQHLHYLMLLNMTSSKKILMDTPFQEFLVEEIKISRATLFKVLKFMTESEMISKTGKRGWYKLNGIKFRKRTVRA